MKRADLKKLLRGSFPEAHVAPSKDAWGSSLGAGYVDVFLPNTSVPAFKRLCKAHGVRVFNVGVVPYTGSMLRVDLTGGTGVIESVDQGVRREKRVSYPSRSNPRLTPKDVKPIGYPKDAHRGPKEVTMSTAYNVAQVTSQQNQLVEKIEEMKRRADAYLRLVETLRVFAAWNRCSMGADGGRWMAKKSADLLRELGEL